MSVSTTASKREGIRAWLLDACSAVVKNGRVTTEGTLWPVTQPPQPCWTRPFAHVPAYSPGSECLEDQAAFIFEWHRICQNWFATYKWLKNETKRERKHSAYIKGWWGPHEKCMRSTSRASGISKCTINFSYHHHHQQQQQQRPRGYYCKERNHSKAEKAFITKLESKPLFFDIMPNS